jgi:hypothetical protein
MVNGSAFEMPPNFAWIVTETVFETGLVAMGKVTPELPAGTVTLDGTLAQADVEERPTFSPPEGAGPVNVTVPTEGEPPITLDGFRLKAPSARGEIVSGAVRVEPHVTVIVTVDDFATADDWIENDADVAPASTVTVGEAVRRS